MELIASNAIQSAFPICETLTIKKDLPYEITQHIFSFLSLKDVIATVPSVQDRGIISGQIILFLKKYFSK